MHVVPVFLWERMYIYFFFFSIINTITSLTNWVHEVVNDC